jgi:NADH-quinone oxidoreductase subunit H
MFQLTAYVNMYAFSLLGAFLFLGGWEWPFGRDIGWGYQLFLTIAKMGLFIVFFLWVRASFPRLRVDQLMSYAWKVLIPFSLLQIFLNGLVLVYDLPGTNVWLAATSAAGAAALVFVVYQSVRVKPRLPLRMVAVPARSVLG